MKTLLKYIILNICIFATSLVLAAQHSVLLVILPGCKYCAQAENLLDASGIKYQTRVTQGGQVPQLYVDGQYKGTGVNAVQAWLNQHSSQ